MPMQNPEAIGAVPAQGNPQQPQQGQPGKTLPPEQMAALRKDPEITQAVAQFAGKPIPLERIPDNLLMSIAGAIHKLGVPGAVALFKKSIPPEMQQKIASMGQAQTPTPQVAAPRG